MSGSTGHDAAGQPVMCDCGHGPVAHHLGMAIIGACMATHCPCVKYTPTSSTNTFPEITTTLHDDDSMLVLGYNTASHALTLDWIATTKGFVRSDQIITAEVVRHGPNGPAVEHWTIEVRCLSGISFAGPVTLADNNYKAQRFVTRNEADFRLHQILNAITRSQP